MTLAFDIREIGVDDQIINADSKLWGFVLGMEAIKHKKTINAAVKKILIMLFLSRLNSEIQN